MMIVRGIRIIRKTLITSVIDDECKSLLQRIIELQWSDAVQARVIEAQRRNRYRVFEDEKSVNSQMAIHQYLSRRGKQASAEIVDEEE